MFKGDHGKRFHAISKTIWGIYEWRLPVCFILFFLKKIIIN